VSHSRVVSLDLLRGIAALAVAICHFIQFMGDGVIAESVAVLSVEIFFVLSGYVLAPQLLYLSSAGSNRDNLGIFWVRRWMRTVPAYFVALLLVSAMSHQLGTADFFRYFFYVQNFTHQSNAYDYFAVAWSLSVEEWFYLIFPVVLLSASVFWSGRPAVAALSFIALILMLRSSLGDVGHWGDNVRRVVIYRMDAIAWGFLLNLIVTRTRLLSRLTSSASAAGMIAVAAVAIVLTVRLGDSKAASLEFAFPIYAPLFGIAAVITALCCAKFVERSFELSRISRLLGRLSYSVYLFHVPVLAAAAALPISRIWIFPVWLAGTLTIAALVFQAIERPILAARPAFR
jgi:peptidoglycan/LPS O-acetylase OafA/YrhL